MSEMIEIRSVSSRKDLMTFIKFPWKIYKNEPNWVPPLIEDEPIFVVLIRYFIKDSKLLPRPSFAEDIFALSRAGQFRRSYVDVIYLFKKSSLHFILFLFKLEPSHKMR